MHSSVFINGYTSRSFKPLRGICKKAMDDEAIEGYILRSKEQCTELGEKPTQYFSRQSCNTIHALCVDNYTTIETSRGFLKECNAFYKNLYTEEPTDRESQDWLLEQLDSTMQSEDQALCEEELTVLECHTALSQMESGKLRGTDGFLTEFYSQFWGLLGCDLVDTLNFLSPRVFFRHHSTRESCIYRSRKTILYRSKIGDLSHF